VPVDGATRRAGLLGDLLQRGLRNALGLEQHLGGVEQPVACRERFLFRGTGHCACLLVGIDIGVHIRTRAGFAVVRI
jgi:hypothetical protein